MQVLTRNSIMVSDSSRGLRAQLSLVVLLLFCFADTVVGNDVVEKAQTELDEMVVEGDPRDIPTRSNIGSLTVVDNQELELVRPRHPHEVFARTPGIWVVQNSGQEHLTGLRSAVLAGSGACGSILLLEDNIPIRPVGFCNVNGLFELNIEQADRVAILRGPASSIYGGNAMRGVINVRPFVGIESSRSFGLEAGVHNYRQIRVAWHNENVKTKFHATDTNGFRDETGYGQQKLNVGWTSNFARWEANHSFAMTSLKQETGGYVLGYKAYENQSLRRTNPNPEAYRNAASFRIHSQLDNGTSFYVYPYARMSKMDFLQHFLPGQPREDNEHVSVGSMLFQMKRFHAFNVNLGAHAEWMKASLIQHQQSPTTGSEFLQATRPIGTHYDFMVVSTTFALFQSSTLSWHNQHELEQSVRIEHTRYQYENRHLDGNTRDDGSICGFGGCLYTRPSDRNDSFTNIAARIGYEYLANDRSNFWVLSSIGYRPPQITELYRLQSGQSVADLKSENTRSVEFGWRTSSQKIDFSVAAYFDFSSNLIFRDAHGLNVSDGATKSQGVEVELHWQINTSHEISVASTFSNHEYDFTREIARGESIVAGNQVDTAPKVLAHVRWSVSFSSTGKAELELNYIGPHYLDANNSARYSGHRVVNFRTEWELSNQWTVFGRILNLLETYYANRADFAFSNYRYFPADLRQFFVGINHSF